ncbi:DUF3761 domain-containing protein [Rouxiella badensis]|uniref:DUF3761 domain-containing protein n=1 Tax=Rouxiella badensis TaxID=1646377 RepID=UPI00178811FC|nr:DUF3761 domain-containing protein [Rouxiella badensis]QOI55935.1 DUF3761 domain-containing protein [Rouxiella badensis subsp. acadiensis]
MRLLALLALTSLLTLNPAIAKQHTRAAVQDDELIEQGDYTNSDGQEVHRPAHSKSDKIPDGASAKCRDGTYSFSTHHRGTCSGHGGVSEWLG